MRTLDRNEELTLTDLMLIVQDLTCSEEEVVEVVSGLLGRTLASASTSIGA